MKSAVETLSPTRVKLTVEVPFDELQPSLATAYRKIGQQVRVKGFRPGKVPPRILDQYVGRAAVLEEAVNDALPKLYGEAVRENSVDIIGHPDIEVTNFTDGDQLVFTAEVDVRPEIELPDYSALPVTVDDPDPSDEMVEAQIGNLRERFATLKTAERAVQVGDYVSLDLAASIDGEPIEDAAANNLSYEVGSDALVQGLDDALVGLSAGESKQFETQLRAGNRGGETASATVTVRSVKQKDLPELDDDFAQTASEFDSLDELRADLRTRIERIGRMQQGVQARDKVLEALLERAEVPIPEHVLADEVTYRKQSMDQQLAAAGMTKDQYAEMESQSVDEIDTEIETNARQAIKAQFLLDAIARKEELSVSEPELTDQIVRRARQNGLSPEQYAQEIVNQGQLGALMSEVLRGKALALLLENAAITDASGRPVNLDELTEEFSAPAEDTAAAGEVAANEGDEAGEGEADEAGSKAADEEE